nr:hypothetical protein [Chromobacterium sp. ASV5]
MQTLTQLANSQRGRGPYGVDAGYFDRKLARVIPALDNYKPADLAREFARMAMAADADAARAELSPADEQSGNSKDSALASAALVALDYIARIHGAPPERDLEMESAFVALSLMVSLKPYMSAAGSERNQRSFDAIRVAYNAGLSIERPQPTVTEPDGWREAIQNASSVLGWMATRSDVCQRDMDRMEAADAALRALLAAAPQPAQQSAPVVPDGGQPTPTDQQITAALYRAVDACLSIEDKSVRATAIRRQAVAEGFALALKMQGTPARQLPVVIEQIAQQWDGCIYDAEGSGMIDIGEAIRAAGKRLMHEQQEGGE